MNAPSEQRWIALRPVEGHFIVPADLAVQILDRALVAKEVYDEKYNRIGTELADSAIRVEMIDGGQITAMKVRERMMGGSK